MFNGELDPILGCHGVGELQNCWIRSEVTKDNRNGSQQQTVADLGGAEHFRSDHPGLVMPFAGCTPEERPVMIAESVELVDRCGLRPGQGEWMTRHQSRNFVR